jgi:hypothetical protein
MLSKIHETPLGPSFKTGNSRLSQFCPLPNQSDTPQHERTRGQVDQMKRNDDNNVSLCRYSGVKHSSPFIFHHADGRLLGAPANAILRSHFVKCWDETAVLARPQYVLQHIIADRGTHLLTAAGQMATLTCGEAVPRILQLYRRMATNRSRQQRRKVAALDVMPIEQAGTLLVALKQQQQQHQQQHQQQQQEPSAVAPPTMTNGNAGGVGAVSGQQKPSEWSTSPPSPPEISSSAAETTTMIVMTTTKLHYIRALQRQKRLLLKRNAHRAKQDANELAIVNMTRQVRQYIEWWSGRNELLQLLTDDNRQQFVRGEEASSATGLAPPPPRPTIVVELPPQTADEQEEQMMITSSEREPVPPSLEAKTAAAHRRLDSFRHGSSTSKQLRQQRQTHAATTTTTTAGHNYEQTSALYHSHQEEDEGGAKTATMFQDDNPSNIHAV